MTADPGLAAAARIAERLLPGAIDRIERVHGFGRNSGVYRVCRGGACYALKQYPPRRDGERGRVDAEIGALRFMTGHGIDAVPKPLAGDAERGYALLEWIEGAPVAAPSAADIDVAIDFLAAIHALRQRPGAEAQPLAAEACLSGAEIVGQIERRLRRLDALEREEPDLAAFLTGDVRPLAARIAGWAETGYAAHGLSFSRPIDASARTLCPSDFGFHNALRRGSGELVFIDFDYFGWDDPVKLTADFLLHPGMQLSEPLRRRFAGAAATLYRGDPTYGQRLALLYPLFALRWCMILLNEFLPERWAHRLNAGALADWPTAKQRQLDRVRERVHSLAANFRWFPYGK